jgi:Ca-activated chloride channel family protein
MQSKAFTSRAESRPAARLADALSLVNVLVPVALLIIQIVAGAEPIMAVAFALAGILAGQAASPACAWASERTRDFANKARDDFFNVEKPADNVGRPDFRDYSGHSGHSGHSGDMPLVSGTQPYSVTELRLIADVRGQMASGVLATGFRNLTRETIEIDYLAPLPRGASVVSAVLAEDGREIRGKVYSREEAYRMYTEAAAEAMDPALVEYAGNDSFRARIFPVPAGETRTLALKMSFLVPRERGVCAMAVPLAGPATRRCRLESQKVEVRFRDPVRVANVYSPVEGVVIDRSDSGCSASLERSGEEAVDSFRLFYRTGAGGLGASLLSHRNPDAGDGYFLFLAEPGLDEGARLLSKDVCFVLDISGSMCGGKFDQAMGALRFVLDRLGPEDRFGLVHFSEVTGRWRDTLTPMTGSTRAECREYLSGLEPCGRTDMGTPLETALGMMVPGRPGYVLFMTDGEANWGICDEAGLAGILARDNRAGSRVFSFGVGYDLNARLLERLASISGGSTVFVEEGENIETGVSGFFSRLTSPVLTSPVLSCSLPLNRMTPERLPDLFSGGQIAVTGRYPRSGPAVFELSGLVNGERRTFRHSFELSPGPSQESDFLGALWATRRSAQILERLDLSDLSGSEGVSLRRELTGELVSLARSHGVLTPYTSFLAADDMDLNRTEDNVCEALDRLGLLDGTSGRRAVRERARRRRDSEKLSPRLTQAELVRLRAAVTGPRDPRGPRILAADECDALLRHFPSCDEDEDCAEDEDCDEALEALVPPKTIGGRTFFQKAGVLVEGDLTDGELFWARDVRQFSPGYFALASEIPPAGLGWLSQAFPVVFRWGGNVYRILPVTSRRSS